MYRFVLAIVFVALALPPAVPRVQDEDAGLCIDPTIEFPVPCDEDEE